MTYETQADAIEAICTHVCRKAPRLRLNPRHCDTRKEKAKGKAAGGNPAAVGYSPYWLCRGCDGPMLPEEIPSSTTKLKLKEVVQEIGPSTLVKLCKYKAHVGGYLPLDNDHFYKDSRSSDGFGSYCKVCSGVISLASWYKKKGKERRANSDEVPILQGQKSDLARSQSRECDTR